MHDVTNGNRARRLWEEGHLASALTDVVDAVRPPAPSVRQHPWDDGPLLSACRTVGRSQDIHFLDAQGPSDADETLDKLGDRFGFNFRDVTLGDAWYHRDLGPLVAWTTDGSPIALRRRGRRYWRTDFGEAGEICIDPATAAAISTRAAVLYRRFPETGPPGRMLASAALAASRDQVPILIFACSAIGALALALPISTGLLFGTTVVTSDKGQLLAIMACLIALVLGRTIFDGIIAFTMLRIESKVEQALYASVWDRLVRLPSSFFRRYLVGDLDQRGHVPIALSRSGAGVVSAALAAVGSTLSGILMIVLGGWTGVLCLALLLAGYGLAAGIVAGARGLVRQWYEAEARLAGFSLQIIQLVGKLRVGGAERRAFAIWARHFAPFARAARRAEQRLVGGNWVADQMPLMLVVAACIGVVSRPGAMDLGEFVAFMVAMGQFIFACGTLSAKVETVLTLHRMGNRMSAILAEPTEASSPKRIEKSLRGEVEFRRVGFRYDGGTAPILEDISFIVKPGQMLAIVGPSGAGKSTLARLLLGFEKPSAGTILIDGEDIAELDQLRTRRQMGVVLQHSGLTGGSIYLNIAAGTALSLEDAWAAAEVAELAADIRAMPMGMNTRINEDGSLLSGGQRQRLMLARAIARHPSILLFDEATSAIDNAVQNIVVRKLKMLGVTRIFIAHRLSTVRDTDTILVLDNGHIVERGSYDDLLLAGGLFARLARRQMKS